MIDKRRLHSHGKEQQINWNKYEMLSHVAVNKVGLPKLVCLAHLAVGGQDM